jgi:hypothetical protein
MPTLEVDISEQTLDPLDMLTPPSWCACIGSRWAGIYQRTHREP